MNTIIEVRLKNNLVFAHTRTRLDVKRKRKLAQCAVAFKAW